MQKIGSSPFGHGFQNVPPAEAMMAIVREMKELPELPSENPGNDVSTLDRVDAPDEGGVLTYLSSEEEPYRGFPFFEMVEKIDLMKKVSRGTLSSLFHSAKKRPKILFLGLVFVPWLISDLVKAYLYAMYRIVLRFRLKPNYYCQAMRELHRSLSEKDEFTSQIRDLICMVLEMDNAYRFRFQDVIVELDKGALGKNPSKELSRLLSILQNREKGQDVKDTWTLLKTFLPLVFLSGKVKRGVVQVLLDLDLSKVALTKEDKWYAFARKDYTCGFITNPTEEDRVLITRVKRNMEKKEARIKVRDESTKAHQELFARQVAELAISPEENEEAQMKVQEVQARLQTQANLKFEQERKQILEEGLTPERRAIYLKHRQEIDEMDKFYNDKLSAIENIT